MSRILSYALGLLVAITLPRLAVSEPAKVGDSAPDFTLRSAQGAGSDTNREGGRGIVIEGDRRRSSGGRIALSVDKEGRRSGEPSRNDHCESERENL